MKIKIKEKTRKYLLLFLTIFVVAFILTVTHKTAYTTGEMVGISEGIYYSEGNEGICEIANGTMLEDGLCLFKGAYIPNSTSYYSNRINCSWGEFQSYSEKETTLIDKTIQKLLHCEVNSEHVEIK